MGFLHCCFHDPLQRLLSLMRRRFHELVLLVLSRLCNAMNAILLQSRNSFVQTSGARVPVHLFAQRRSETLHISGQYLDAGVNLRFMPAFFGGVLRAAACDSPSSVCAAYLLALVWRHCHCYALLCRLSPPQRSFHRTGSQSYPQHRKKQQSLHPYGRHENLYVLHLPLI